MSRWVQCVLAGLAAAAVAAVAMGGWIWWMQYQVSRSLPNDSVEVVFHWQGWRVLGLFVVVFAAGFWWRYEKSR